MSLSNNRFPRRRKHLNRKNPERRNRIKVNLRDLPDKNFLRSLELQLLSQILESYKREPKLPAEIECFFSDRGKYERAMGEYTIARTRWQEKHEPIKVALGMVQRAYAFARAFGQIDTRDLALAAIREVQPTVPVEFRANDVCASCKNRGVCPLLKLDPDMRSSICKKIPTAQREFGRQAENIHHSEQMNYSANATKLIANAWEIHKN
jgi:hypothetical protein